jgi:hypothetical protein
VKTGVHLVGQSEPNNAQLNFTVRLEPPLDGHVLDAESQIMDRSVFFEVVAPERPDASLEAQRLVNVLTTTVRDRVLKARVELEIRGSLDDRASAGAAFGRVRVSG